MSLRKILAVEPPHAKIFPYSRKRACEQARTVRTKCPVKFFSRPKIRPVRVRSSLPDQEKGKRKGAETVSLSGFLWYLLL